jgi:hypothetical protein
MDLEHVRPFVEPGLILGASLSLLGRNAEILQRRRGRTGGRSVRQILLWRWRWFAIHLFAYPSFSSNTAASVPLTVAESISIVLKPAASNFTR